MPTIDDENALVVFLDGATPACWLAFMRWAVPELAAKNQRLLAELVTREADRRRTEWRNDSRKVSDEIAGVLSDLNLRLICA